MDWHETLEEYLKRIDDLKSIQESLEKEIYLKNSSDPSAKSVFTLLSRNLLIQEGLILSLKRRFPKKCQSTNTESLAPNAEEGATPKSQIYNPENLSGKPKPISPLLSTLPSLSTLAGSVLANSPTEPEKKSQQSRTETIASDTNLVAIDLKFVQEDSGLRKIFVDSHSFGTEVIPAWENTNIYVELGAWELSFEVESKENYKIFEGIDLIFDIEEKAVPTLVSLSEAAESFGAIGAGHVASLAKRFLPLAKKVLVRYRLSFDRKTAYFDGNYCKLSEICFKENDLLLSKRDTSHFGIFEKRTEILDSHDAPKAKHKVRCNKIRVVSVGDHNMAEYEFEIDPTNGPKNWIDKLYIWGRNKKFQKQIYEKFEEGIIERPLEFRDELKAN